jgi:hypothetical protein
VGRHRTIDAKTDGRTRPGGLIHDHLLQWMVERTSPKTVNVVQGLGLVRGLKFEHHPSVT